MMMEWPGVQKQQLLVVNDPGELARFLRGRYPTFDVNVMPSYLAGITSLGAASARAVVVGVDPASRKLPQAIAGLRKAAGDQARLVLCCSPGSEPIARESLSAGADDYVIYPPRGDELD